MATYMELFGLRSDSDLQDKVLVAVVKTAQTLLDGETPTAAEVEWASAAIESPKAKADALLNYVLAKNSGVEVGAISGASDATIQTAVDAAVAAIVAGGA